MANSAFQDFIDRAFPEGGSGPGLVYTSYDMQEAFEAGAANALLGVLAGYNQAKAERHDPLPAARFPL